MYSKRHATLQKNDADSAYYECSVAFYGVSSFNLAVDRTMDAFGLIWMQVAFIILLKRDENRTQVLRNIVSALRLIGVVSETHPVT